MDKDPFFDRDYYENLSPEEAAKEIKKSVDAAEGVFLAPGRTWHDRTITDRAAEHGPAAEEGW